jgi:tRNA pseudouridine55 synthase
VNGPQSNRAGRRRPNPERRLNGWLVVDKPKGLTSAQAVARVKRLTGAAKAGHAGTLDPLATGVLPIALGEATKTVSYVMDGAKTYRFTVRWGEARATDDAEGAVTETCPERPDEAAIHAILPRFRGQIEQVPPIYSAIKVEGRRAYEMARADETVVLAPRTVTIRRLDLVAMPDDDRAVFEVECGKGTYMRSLARDIALAVGTVGHVEALRRLRVGRFGEEQAISLEQEEHIGHSLALVAHLLPLETALDDIPALALTESEAHKLQSGQAVALPVGGADGDTVGVDSGGLVRIVAGGRLVALARVADGNIRTVRGINL